MSQKGMGVMINELFGGRKHGSDEYAGKTISAVDMSDNVLNLTFADGIRIHIKDDGQSCCESRYMQTDDNLQDLVGHKLVEFDLKSGGETVREDWEIHEIQFLEVRTDINTVSIANHVEHNGYYGGFYLVIEQDGDKED